MIRHAAPASSRGGMGRADIKEIVLQNEDGSAGGSVKHGYNAVKSVKV